MTSTTFPQILKHCETMESESYIVHIQQQAALAFGIFCQFSTRDVEISDLRGPHTNQSQDFEEVVALKRTQSCSLPPPVAVAKAKATHLRLTVLLLRPFARFAPRIDFSAKKTIVKTPFWKTSISTIEELENFLTEPTLEKTRDSTLVLQTSPSSDAAVKLACFKPTNVCVCNLSRTARVRV